MIDLEDLTWHEPSPNPKGAGALALKKLYELAQECGWRVRLVVAAGPPVNMTMRVSRGARRAYGAWDLSSGIKYRGGVHNRVESIWHPPMLRDVPAGVSSMLKNVKALGDYLEGCPDD